MIVLKNDFVSAAFDPETGRLSAFGNARSGNVIRRICRPFDVVVDGSSLLSDDDRPAIVSQSACAVSFRYRRGDIQIEHHARVDEKSACLYQDVAITANAGARRILSAVHWTVHGLLPGSAVDCVLQAPGQRLPPDLAYARAAAAALDRTVTEPLPGYPSGWLEPAPDQSAGIVAVENRRTGITAAAWMLSDVATVFPTLDGDGDLVTIEHRHQVAAILTDRPPTVSDEYVLMIAEGGVESCLAAYRTRFGDRIGGGMPTPNPAAADLRLLQIVPNGNVVMGDGDVETAPIRFWTERLGLIQDLGFNAVYLLPIWSCQDGHPYALDDHYAIDKGVGTIDDVKTFVSVAHDHGIKVLFDYIPQGFGDRSRMAATHRDWLVKDRFGRPFGSHGWGPKPGEPPCGHTYSVDWGNPDYRKWAIDWALWNVRTFDIDGFRTDALHWKEPNFDPDNARPAWETTFGGIKLASELRGAVRAIKSDFVLLGEVWGPIFGANHDATYDNGWLLSHLNAMLLKGEPLFSARQWMRWSVLNCQTMPAGFPRANFTLNHDSVHLLPLTCGPSAQALTFVQIFKPGIPFVFSQELRGREKFFQELLSARRGLAGFTAEYLFGEETDQNLHAVLWQDGRRRMIAAFANLSARPIDTPTAAPAAEIRIMVASPGATITAESGYARAALAPWGYALAELRPAAPG